MTTTHASPCMLLSWPGLRLVPILKFLQNIRIFKGDFTLKLFDKILLYYFNRKPKLQLFCLSLCFQRLIKFLSEKKKKKKKKTRLIKSSKHKIKSKVNKDLNQKHKRINKTITIFELQRLLQISLCRRCSMNYTD